MTKIKKTTIIIVAMAIVLLAFWFTDFMAVDSCLDQGGKWDYDKEECIFN